MYKAVIFDLDDTLYGEKEYFEKICLEFLKTNSDLVVDKRDVENALIHIDRNSRDVLGDFLRRIGHYSVGLQEELFVFYKNASISISLSDETLQVIEQLKNKDIALGIITNGVVEVQKNKIQNMNLYNIFDNIIIARELGQEKPNPISFEQMLERLNYTHEECVFVGDSVMNDIRGAQGVGMDTAWMLQYVDEVQKSSAKKLEITPTYIVNELKEILLYV